MQVVRESEWDEVQAGWMLALHLYRSQIGPCGHYLPHTTAEDAEERYTASDPVRCHACTATAAKADSYLTNAPHPQALLFPVERR